MCKDIIIVGQLVCREMVAKINCDILQLVGGARVILVLGLIVVQPLG